MAGAQPKYAVAALAAILTATLAVAAPPPDPAMNETAVLHYFAAHYIEARESYAANRVRENYNIVRVMSSPDEFMRVRTMADPSNPQSFAASLGTIGQRSVRILSVDDAPSQPATGDIPPDHTIRVRFATVDMKPDTPDRQATWTATLTFRYLHYVGSYANEEMLINPLGMSVVHYQLQKENA